MKCEYENCDNYVNEEFMDSDHKYCIFHSNNINKAQVFNKMLSKKIRTTNARVLKIIKDIERFNKNKNEIKEKIEVIRMSNALIFDGFFFPSGLSFENIEFQMAISLSDAIFQKDINFRNVIFHAPVNFSSSLIKYVEMSQVICKDFVDFTGCRLNEALFFNIICMSELYFEKAIVKKSLKIFYSSFLKKVNFNDFSCKSLLFDTLFFFRGQELRISKSCYASFDNCIYYNDCHFTIDRDHNIRFRECQFLNNNVFKMSVLDNTFFIKSYLGGILFKDCDLVRSKISFCSFDWSKVFPSFPYPNPHVISGLYLSYLNDRSDYIKIKKSIKDHNILLNNMKLLLNNYNKKVNLLTINNIKIIKERERKRVFALERNEILYNEYYYHDDLNHEENIYLEPDIYRQLKVNMDNIKDFNMADTFYYNEMEARRRTLYKIIYSKRYKIEWNNNKKYWKQNIWLNINKILANNNNHILILSIIIIFLSLKALITLNSFVLTDSRWLIYVLIGALIYKEHASYFFLTLYKFLSGYGNKPIRVITIYTIFTFITSSLTRIPYQFVDLQGKLIDINITDFIISNQVDGTGLIMTTFNPSNNIMLIILFFIRYVFRPLMITLFIIAVRRKIKR